MVRTPAITDEPFLRAIIESPDDDVPRLVYADYLEERGDPRGTFIRAQCQRFHLTHHDQEWKALLAQEAALLKRHEAEWTAPVRRHVDEIQFSRGFIEHVRIAPTKFSKHAERLFRVAPLRSVLMLQVTMSELDRLADCPHLAKLDTLYLRWSSEGFGSREARILAQSPFVAPLQSLDLASCKLGPSGAAEIAGATNLSSLRKLALGFNDIGPAGAIALAASPHLAKLAILKLRHNELGPEGARALATDPAFRLMMLDLSFNGIANQGTVAFAGSSACANLRHLELHENAISNLGIEAIARSPHLTQLEHLNLETNRINDRGIHALADSTAFVQLAYLNVAYNEFGPAAAKALASSPHFPRMRQMQLGQHAGK